MTDAERVYRTTIMTETQRRSMFMSDTDEWATPRDFFRQLDAEFHFELDVCATAENATCARFLSFPNGLFTPWAPARCWMNPPYGREIPQWLHKAEREAGLGALVVALLPARTDTFWWHEIVMKADEVRFVRGRLRYNDGPRDMRSPFPSCLVIWKPLPRAL